MAPKRVAPAPKRGAAKAAPKRGAKKEEDLPVAEPEVEEEEEEPDEPEEAEEDEEEDEEDVPEPPAKKAKALPARGAVIAKAKAKPKAKAKAKAKGKAKAKAGPRGVIKAIAAKEFAAVSAKLKKSASKETVAGKGKWYFMSDLRKIKAGADDEAAWTKYTPKMNKQLEDAYSKGFKQYTMTFKDKQYIVKFNTMMQFRADDKSLQRPVKRE
ncbi:unnamed protein product [Effrenium voratum]|uniref:WWE domain-containing protein n=2 Tax=Effrenium voratum TaxID=2562239 RepID=A0AA36MHV5_9DINO|nr:unnamed protein product [Effrenium voratum]